MYHPVRLSSSPVSIPLILRNPEGVIKHSSLGLKLFFVIYETINAVNNFKMLVSLVPISEQYA